MDATELTRATNLAAEMTERIQYNRKNIGQYVHDTNNATPCPQSATTQAMAKGDCDQWVALLNNPQASGLVNVRGIIAVTAPVSALKMLLNENAVTVTVQWTGATGATNRAGKTGRPDHGHLTGVSSETQI